MGHSRTGPPRSVSRPTAHASGGRAHHPGDFVIVVIRREVSFSGTFESVGLV